MTNLKFKPDKVNFGSNYKKNLNKILQTILIKIIKFKYNQEIFPQMMVLELRNHLLIQRQYTFKKERKINLKNIPYL